MAYTDDWENLMNGVFGAGGRPRFGGTAQPESKTPKAKAPAVPDLNAALLENQKQLDALLKKQNAQLKRRTLRCSLLWRTAARCCGIWKRTACLPRALPM